jgi:hypothetical protein
MCSSLDLGGNPIKHRLGLESLVIELRKMSLAFIECDSSLSDFIMMTGHTLDSLNIHPLTLRRNRWRLFIKYHLYSSGGSGYTASRNKKGRSCNLRAASNVLNHLTEEYFICIFQLSLR